LKRNDTLPPAGVEELHPTRRNSERLPVGLCEASYMPEGIASMSMAATQFVIVLR
jgi:hypothetical protein